MGEYLAKCPADQDGTWPCQAVRNVLEELKESEIARGMVIGAMNSRRAVWRGVGGAQERELAAKYKSWSEKLMYEYPYVSQKILNEIVENYEDQANWHDTDESVRKRLI